MDGGDRLRQRMAAAGIELSPELADIVIAAAGPMVTALDDLIEAAPVNVEPFHPTERLSEDAAD